MYVFDLAKIRLSSKKTNYYSYKKKNKYNLYKNETILLNKVLINQNLINLVSQKKRIYFKPNFLKIFILFDKLWPESLKFKEFLKNDINLRFIESSSKSTLYRKNMSNVFLGDKSLKNSFTLLNCNFQNGFFDLNNLLKFSLIFKYNKNSSRFLKIFTKKYMLNKESFNNLNTFLNNKKYSNIYMQLLVTADYINFYKLATILQKFKK